MKIQPRQLNHNLSQQLLPVYLVCGDEPLLIQEACDAVRQSCRQQGFSERSVYHAEGQFDWSQLGDEGQSLSLFAEKKLIELRIPKGKPGTQGSKAICEYLAAPPEDNILLIITPRIDATSQKSAWFKAIDKCGGVVQIWPVALHEVPGWIQERAKGMGMQLDKDALHSLTEKVEGNLLAAHQELEKLRLLSTDSPLEATPATKTQQVTLDQIEQSVADSATYDVFNLVDECLKGNTHTALRMLSRLRAEGVEPAFILWTLGKDIRTSNELAVAQHQGHSSDSVFKKQWTIKKRQGLLTRFSQKTGLRRNFILLQQCRRVDDAIKGLNRNISSWDELADIVVSMCQPQRISF